MRSSILREEVKTIASLIAAMILALSLKYIITSMAGVQQPLVVVEGKSMIPTLWSGDLVLIHRVAGDNIHIGDIIVYRALLSGHYVIHRVVDINIVFGKYYYVTKGDFNAFPDNITATLQERYGISYDNVEGKVVSIDLWGHRLPLRIPYIGYIILMFQ